MSKKVILFSNSIKLLIKPFYLNKNKNKPKK